MAKLEFKLYELKEESKQYKTIEKLHCFVLH